jgi:hypothetical protein
MQHALGMVAGLFKKDRSDSSSRHRRLPIWKGIYTRLDTALKGVDIFKARTVLEQEEGFVLTLVISTPTSRAYKASVTVTLEQALKLKASPGRNRDQVSYRYDHPMTIASFKFLAGSPRRIHRTHKAHADDTMGFFYGAAFHEGDEELRFQDLTNGVVAIVSHANVSSGMSSTVNNRTSYYDHWELRWYTSRNEAVAAYQAACELLVSSKAEDLEYLQIPAVSP